MRARGATPTHPLPPACTCCPQTRASAADAVPHGGAAHPECARFTTQRGLAHLRHQLRARLMACHHTLHFANRHLLSIRQRVHRLLQLHVLCMGSGAKGGVTAVLWTAPPPPAYRCLLYLCGCPSLGTRRSPGPGAAHSGGQSPPGTPQPPGGAAPLQAACPRVSWQAQLKSAAPA